ncbi:hypothetical protein CEXT_408591 [Caerostris extrusa]|uniref:Uncharacterized protein n=1 Tax=Caerostris extrusa TaxID=172846 RepID=A0AAV4MGU3_CAEEX|nr:hypothetical protein CEXT_408591 [Caerostris extrusa]
MESGLFLESGGALSAGRLEIPRRDRAGRKCRNCPSGSGKKFGFLVEGRRDRFPDLFVGARSVEYWQTRNPKTGQSRKKKNSGILRLDRERNLNFWLKVGEIDRDLFVGAFIFVRGLQLL